MRIDRPIPKRRTSTPMFVCGCLAVLALGVVVVGVIVVLVVVPLLPGFALQSAGFTPKGNTEQVFANVPAVPTVEVQNPVTPPQAVINFGSYGSQDLPQTQDYTIAVGNTIGGPVATVSFTEPGLMSLCLQRTDLCSNTNPDYRNARIDLRPSGAVIYADVFIKDFSLWQPIGVVLQLDSSLKQFVVTGVDVNGTLYSVPPNGLGDTVTQIATTGNDILRQLSLEASGGQYHLQEVVIDDTTLTLVMR